MITNLKIAWTMQVQVFTKFKKKVSGWYLIQIISE